MMSLLYRAPEPAAAVPDVLVDQLWRSAASADRLRLARGTTSGDPGDTGDSGWEEVERYVVAPSLERPVMLLPDLPRPVLADALRNYRRLRPAGARVRRRMLAAALGSGLPLPLPRLSVQVPAGGPRPELPLAAIREALGDRHLHASIGVRRGANRKATLQLVDTAGAPRGFAKVAWDDSSAAGVVREAAALRRAPRTGPARAPQLLATGDVAGRPFLVTAPLPPDAHAVRAAAPPPSAVELGALCPLTRRAPLGATGQLTALRKRLACLASTEETGGLLALAGTVVARLAEQQATVPVTAHWHGDLTPWNCARTAGTLWAWDWESSEEDAAAGLDAVHWAWSVRSERGERLRRDTVSTLVSAAEPLLVAMGVPRASRGQVGALWAATLVERACSWAAARGDWDEDWVVPHELHRLVAGALDVLGGPSDASDPEGGRR